MPKVDFKETVSAEVKVGGKSQTGAPPIGVPVGPRTFPPPPPPPPPPLTISSHAASIGAGFFDVVFSRAAIAGYNPGWTLTGSAPPTITSCFFNDETDLSLTTTGPLVGDEVLHIPANLPTVRALGDNGTVPATVLPLF